MSQLLRHHPDDVNALVAATAQARGLPSAHVEKDFWVTEVLRAAVVNRLVAMPDGSTGHVRFIFKGGTSLSRVFGILDRFSEDVDLLADFPDGAGLNARHKVLKQVNADVTNHLGLTPGDVTVGQSTTGVKRYTTYLYPSRHSDRELREGVLLELGSRGGTHPTLDHPYRSLVADFAITELGEPEDTWQEFESFSVRVLAPERTLLEKLAAVHDAAVRSDDAQLLKHGRHFYDIGRLLNSASVVDALTELGPVGLTQLVQDIEAHSQLAGFSWSPRPAGGYADSPAFDPTNASILAGYAAAQHLVHGTSIPFEDVCATVEAHRALL